LFVVKFFAELRSYRTIGSTANPTISVSGYGEVQAVPDIAQFDFSITKEAKTVKEAQDEVTTIEKSVIDALKELGIADKDIKTTNTSLSPVMEWQSDRGVRLACNQWGCPPSAGRQVIVAYQASESINVKVRKTEDAGEVQQALGDLGVTYLSGPNFSIDDEESLKMSARREAIKNAEEKAKALASDLGVKVGRIASFSEDGGYYPFYAKAEASNQAADASVGAPELPKGENTISSSVTVTYEIR
jgi:uncharacterized protein YggE